MDEIYIGVKSWWSFLLKGIAAIAFGIILLVWPASTLRVFAYLVGALALIIGAIETIWSIVLLVEKEKAWLLLARGLISLLVGLLLVLRTGFTFALVVVLIAIWEIVTGFVELVVALEMPKASGRGLLGFSAVLSIILGILLLVLPLETVFAVIIVISIFLIIGGIVNIVEAFYAKKMRKEILGS